MTIFFEKLCHHSSAFILTTYHKNVNYDNILDKFEFERSRTKVKVTVAVFRKKKNIVIALEPLFINRF